MCENVRENLTHISANIKLGVAVIDNDNKLPYKTRAQIHILYDPQ